MPARFACLLLPLVCLLPVLALADVVRVEVPTDSRDAAAEQHAIEQGFLQALQQLSSDTTLSETDPLLQQAGDKSRYLSSYWDQPASEGGGFIYVLEFERVLLAALLPPGSNVAATADTPRIPAAQTATASSSDWPVWIVMQLLETGNKVVNAAAIDRPWVSEIRSIIREQPSLTLADVPAGLDMAQLAAALEQRQDAELMQLVGATSQGLAVILTESGPTSWLARVHRLGKPDEEFYGDAATPGEALVLAIDNLGLPATVGSEDNIASAATLASVSPSSGVLGDDAATMAGSVDTGGGVMVVRIANIHGYEQYRRATRFLESVPAISAWIPQGSQDDVAQFELSYRGSSEALLQALTASSGETRLDLAHGATDAQLHRHGYLFTLR